MLELLSLRKGTTLTKEMFLNNLYGGIDEPEIRAPEVVALATELRGRRMSLRKISAALADRGYLTAGGKPYVASAVQAMLAGDVGGR